MIIYARLFTTKIWNVERKWISLRAARVTKHDTTKVDYNINDVAVSMLIIPQFATSNPPSFLITLVFEAIQIYGLTKNKFFSNSRMEIQPS